MNWRRTPSLPELNEVVLIWTHDGPRIASRFKPYNKDEWVWNMEESHPDGAMFFDPEYALRWASIPKPTSLS